MADALGQTTDKSADIQHPVGRLVGAGASLPCPVVQKSCLDEWLHPLDVGPPLFARSSISANILHNKTDIHYGRTSVNQRSRPDWLILQLSQHVGTWGEGEGGRTRGSANRPRLESEFSAHYIHGQTTKGRVILLN